MAMKIHYLILPGVLLVAFFLALRILPVHSPVEPKVANEFPTTITGNPRDHGGNGTGDDLAPRDLFLGERPLPGSPYVDRHRSSLASSDTRECQEAFLNLLQHLEADPREFAGIVAALQSDPALVRNLPTFAAAIPDAFSANGDSRNRLLREVALALATFHNDAGIRSLALSVLEKLPLDDPRMIEVAIRASRDGPREEIGSAISAMAAWAKETSPFREDATLELVDMIAELEDPGLWLDAVRSVISAHSEVPDSLATVLLEILAANPSSENYLRVAQAVSGSANGANKVLTVELLGTAFLEEDDSGTRSMILNDMLELGGAESVAWAQTVRLDNETLSPDAREYLEILQSGFTDPREIRELKTRRNAERGNRSDGT